MIILFLKGVQLAKNLIKAVKPLFLQKSKQKHKNKGKILIKLQKLRNK